MASFIGSNLQSLEFSCDFKIVGDSQPIKVYQNSTELTQSQYDILKSQDSNIITGDIEVEIDVMHVVNDVYGGSLEAFKSALLSINNANFVWNGTMYETYNIDNKLTYVTSEGKMKFKFTDADYINIIVNISRQPDNVVIPETVKNTYIPTNYTIFTQVACLITNNKKIITQYYKDDNNYIELNVENNKVNFVKCVNGVTVTLSSNNLDYGKYQVIGIIAQQQNTGMKLSVIKNGNPIEHFTNTDTNLLNVMTEWKLGQNVNITNQLDGFIVDYQFLSRNYNTTECEVMLKGRNEVDISNESLNSLAKTFSNGVEIIHNKEIEKFIDVLPNNRYKIESNADDEGYSVYYYVNNLMVDRELIKNEFEHEIPCMDWNVEANTYVQNISIVKEAYSPNIAWNVWDSVSNLYTQVKSDYLYGNSVITIPNHVSKIKIVVGGQLEENEYIKISRLD